MSTTILFAALGASAQSAATPDSSEAKDKPSFNVGATLFGDYTYVDSPTTKDADGNDIHASSFNITRAYLNVTGSLNHRIAYRITPDVTREGGSGSSLSGSQTFRLKYAYGQFNLDDWTTKGSWVRAGLHQTPYIDYEEGIYRYRFQGTAFVDREGFLIPSDTGVSAHWNFPGDYGDVHAGFYNGEGYAKAETNDEKAFQIRGTVRPFPTAGPALKGLRLTAFIDADHYVSDAKRQRLVAEVSYEHPRVNAGLTILHASDRTSSTKPELEGEGYSIWATPKLPSHFELLLRHDEMKPDNHADQKRKRNIVGLAYWVPDLQKVTAALMVDYDSLEQQDFSRPDDTRFGVKMLINF